MKLIQGKTLARGWLEACEHLLTTRGWQDTTVVLSVDEPALMSREDKCVADTLNTFLVSHNQPNNHTVAETIFPGYEYIHRGVDGVFKTYPDELYPRLESHDDTRNWGTYAHRLLRRTDRKGKPYNPLEVLINKMREKRPVRASYEIGLGLDVDVATYDSDEDRKSRLGGPCLSHLSFKLLDKSIHLTVMYRFHYYVQRAFGNLLGLARLQSFVAKQVGVSIGPLVCHSTLAVLDHEKGWKKSAIPPLVTACRAHLTSATITHPQLA